MTEEQDKRLQQLRSAFEGGLLDEDTYRAALLGIGVDLPTSSAELSGSGAVAQGMEAVGAGEGGVAIGRNYGNITTVQTNYGNIYAGTAPRDDDEALSIYLRVTAQASGQLPLLGLDRNAADPASAQQPLGLANVYIDLNTKTRVEGGKPKGRKVRNRQDPSKERETRPLGALEAAALNQRMVLLGDPGGGKTTFVKHLTHCVSLHAVQLPSKMPDHLPVWPVELRDLVPIPVILRDFAQGLPDPLPSRVTPDLLWKFICRDLDSRNLLPAGRPIQEALEAGRALLLLDGLDEVAGVARRAFVRDAVSSFLGRYGDRNRCLITCRVLSYQAPVDPTDLDLRVPDFQVFELEAFDEERISRFIGAWYDELARLGIVRHQDARSLATRLREAVHRHDLQRLAPNPLLLTVMALVHAHKGRLPDARTLLYEETVDILLWRWEQLKAGGSAGPPTLRRLMLDAGLNEMDLKRALWQLAYEAHAHIGDSTEQEALADIGELRLLKAMAALRGGDLGWARQVVDVMKIRAGLLLERAPEVFTFPHRTFQEYLAAAYLASQGQFAREASRLAAAGPIWREVILLAVGRLIHVAGDTDKPLALAAELCPAEFCDDETSWRQAWLAADVLLEIGPDRIRDTHRGAELLGRVPPRLVDLLRLNRLSPRERVSAGNSLERLGDPRAWVLDVDCMQFCHVPAGPFWMGGERYDAEKPIHLNDKLDRDYWIARYPVTVAQFRTFAEATSIRLSNPASLTGPATHPVVRVTWHEACAFCDWLMQSWKEKGDLPTGWSVRLPSEAEWEKAARGGLQVPAKSLCGALASMSQGVEMIPSAEPRREYPWGERPDPNQANYHDTGIEATSPVGCFPESVTPYGCEEMAGNVWEWTRSLWGPDLSDPGFKYPYDPADGREDPAAKDDILRVVRGGAFTSIEIDMRCAYRLRLISNPKGDGIGFRVVVSPSP